jgi:hypothetical protein
MNEALSDDPAQKLHAAMVLDGKQPHLALPARYMDACRRWYAGLSEGDKAVAASALTALASGDNARALATAAGLPAAPRFP